MNIGNSTKISSKNVKKIIVLGPGYKLRSFFSMKIKNHVQSVVQAGASNENATKESMAAL